MAKSPTIDTITKSFTSASKLNTNFTAINTSFTNTISRDGSTPNLMTADLDLNSNDLLNVGKFTTGTSSSNISFKGARVYQSVGTNITSSETVLAFGAETFDTHSLHSNSVNNSRLTTDSAGYWVVTGQMTMVDSTKEFEFVKLTIRLNGTTDITEHAYLFEPSLSFDGKIQMQITSDAYLFSSGDYLELLARIVPDDTTETGAALTWFTLRKVGVA